VSWPTELTASRLAHSMAADPRVDLRVCNQASSSNGRLAKQESKQKIRAKQASEQQYSPMHYCHLEHRLNATIWPLLE
jgi:hypothetical protein